MRVLILIVHRMNDTKANRGIIMMKKIGIALIVVLMTASLLIACTPGYTMDRFFSFLGTAVSSGNADSYATNGNVIFVSAGNVVSFGNARIASSGNVVSFGNAQIASSGNGAVASSGNAKIATKGNAALPAFTVVPSKSSGATGGFATPTPAPVK